MSSNTPELGSGLLSGEPCSACREYGEQLESGLCSACRQRLENARRDYLLACNYWAARGRDRPARMAPVGQCPICGRIGKLRMQGDWCAVCHQRWRQTGFAGDRPKPPVAEKRWSRGPGLILPAPSLLPSTPRLRRPPGARRISPAMRRGDVLDRLTIRRVMWALAHPDQENPYECVAPGCHETADPTRRYHCVMHELRLRRNGTYAGYDCIRCGTEVRRRGTQRRDCILCDSCRQAWGYCTNHSHQGERLLPKERMSKAEPWACLDCRKAYLAARRRAAGVPTREEWSAIRRQRSPRFQRKEQIARNTASRARG